MLKGEEGMGLLPLTRHPHMGKPSGAREGDRKLWVKATILCTS